MNHKRLKKKIIDVLDKQISLYQSIFRVSEEQAEAIKKDNAERILELVEEKGQLIKSVKRLDKNEFSYKNITRESCDVLPDSVFKDIQDKIDELYSTLNSIARIEKKNQKNISQKVSDVKTNMKTLQKGQAAYR